MAVARISTYALHSRTMLDVNRTQSELFDLQNQISSGFKTDNFAGLQGSVEHFTSLSAKMDKAKVYQDGNSLALTRIKATNVALENIIDSVDEMENLIVLRRNPAGNQQLVFAQQLKNLRDTFVGDMNSSAGGRYLFGGTKTNMPPVAVPQPSPVVPGTPDNGYYQGSAEDYVVRAQDNVLLSFNVRADDPAFQKIFAGIDMALRADASGRDTEFATAYTLVRKGLDEVIALQAQTNADQVNIEKINERHESMELYWKGVTENIIKTDILGASTKVAVDQGILQASFQTFARINTLRLSDYL